MTAVAGRRALASSVQQNPIPRLRTPPPDAAHAVRRVVLPLEGGGDKGSNALHFCASRCEGCSCRALRLSAPRAQVAAGVDPGPPCYAWLRHELGSRFGWASACPLFNVTPAKAGAHASLCLRLRGRLARACRNPHFSAAPRVLPEAGVDPGLRRDDGCGCGGACRRGKKLVPASPPSPILPSPLPVRDASAERLCGAGAVPG